VSATRAVSIAGPTAFAAAALVGGRRTAGYIARDQPISSLAAHGSAAASTMVPGFLGLATGTVALAAALRGSPAAPGPVPAMLAVAGLSTAAAGLARCSDPSCPTRGLHNGVPKRSDDLHMAFSGVTFALWIATPLVATARATQADHRYRRRSAALGATTAALFVGGGLLAQRPDHRWSGWAQRAMVATALAWQPLAVTAGADRRAERR
jgi:hypothetical protein